MDVSLDHKQLLNSNLSKDDMLSQILLSKDESQYKKLPLGSFNLEFDFLAIDLHDIQMKRKALEFEEKNISDRLKSICQNVSHVSSNFAYIYQSRKGNVDYSNIPELNGVNLDDYRKENVKIWKLIKQ